MHPVTRLGRVIQQLRSFSDLHAGELEGLAVELDAVGAGEVAQRLRSYRDVQRDGTAGRRLQRDHDRVLHDQRAPGQRGGRHRHSRQSRPRVKQAE